MKNFEISKGIHCEFPEKLQKSGVFRTMDELFVMGSRIRLLQKRVKNSK